MTKLTFLFRVAYNVFCQKSEKVYSLPHDDEELRDILYLYPPPGKRDRRLRFFSTKHHKGSIQKNYTKQSHQF